MSGLKAAENPLDFIKNNIRPPATPEQQALPKETIAKVEAERALPKVEVKVEAKSEESKVDGETKTATTTTEPSVSPTATPDKQPTPPSPEVKPSTESLDLEEQLLTDKDLNFKNLRTKVKETTSVLKTKEKELEEVTAKLKKYETGEEIPEPLKQKEARIQELEKYERLHALKLSPAYKESFIKPIDQAKAKLNEYAADYGLPFNVMEKAIGLTNRRDLNQFLSGHFDEIGASEVKQVITGIQDIQNKAKIAEKEPAQALAAIEADFKNIQEARRIESNNKIVEATKSAWTESLYKIRQEGKVTELISKENDPEYNKTYVEPVLQACSTEYARIVRTLADNGLTNLPKDVAFALARMVQLAHGSSIAIEARNSAEKEAAELRASSERTTRYARPQIGASTGTGNVPSGPTALTPIDAAKAILAKVKPGG